MDQEAFASACAWAAARLGQGGIGTLGEKSLHAALKYYFEPCPENHEQPLGGFVADAVGEHGVIEIQSRSLFKLIPKLDAFLEACPVTVVHPLIGKKWVAWYTPEGVPVSRTRAPGKLRLTDAVPEVFGSREIAQVGHMSRDTARMLLNLLCYLELIQPAEQRGNARYYRRVEG